MPLDHRSPSINRFATLIVGVVLCAKSGIAAGADVSDSPNPATAQLQQAAPQSNLDEGDAERLFARAEERYQAGDLKGALELLQQCYAVSEDANLLYNIAQVLRDLQDCSGAVENYRRYVREAPQGERVADATRQISKLELSCGAKQPPKKAQALPAPPPQRRPVSLPTKSSASEFWPIVGWTSCGASVLAAAASIYLGVEAQSAKHDVEQLQRQPRFQADYLQTRLDDFYRDRNWAVGFGVAAGLTAALGIYLLVVAPPEQRQQSRVLAGSVPGRSFDLQLRF